MPSALVRWERVLRFARRSASRDGDPNYRYLWLQSKYFVPFDLPTSLTEQQQKPTRSDARSFTPVRTSDSQRAPRSRLSGQRFQKTVSPFVGKFVGAFWGRRGVV